MLVTDAKSESKELIQATTLQAHKDNLKGAISARDADGVARALQSIRVDALRVVPELRRGYVQELVQNDPFKITESKSFSTVKVILDMAESNNSVKHSFTALTSVIAAVPQGIEYLTIDSDTSVVSAIIEVTPGLYISP